MAASLRTTPHGLALPVLALLGWSFALSSQTLQARSLDYAELEKLLQSDISPPLVRQWVQQHELPEPPTADELIRLRKAGATEDLLAELLQPGPIGKDARDYRIRILVHVGEKGQPPVLELTNRALDGTYPPPPPAAPVQREEVGETKESVAVNAPSLFLPPPARPVPWTVEAPVLYQPVPSLPAPPQRSRSSLVIVSQRPDQASNFLRRRYLQTGQHHYLRDRDLLHYRDPIYFLFDFNLSLQPDSPEPDTAPPGSLTGQYRPHRTRYRPHPIRYRPH